MTRTSLSRSATACARGSWKTRRSSRRSRSCSTASPTRHCWRSPKTRRWCTSGASSASAWPPSTARSPRPPEGESVDRWQELAQHVGVDGLLQVVVDAGESVGDAFVVVLATGDGDQDDVVAVAAAQRSCQLVAVHSRHADVEQHAVRPVRLDERERARAVGRDPDPVSYTHLTLP